MQNAQPEVFGKVYQIDTMTHFETLIGPGHGLAGGMNYTFMPNETGGISVYKVNDELF